MCDPQTTQELADKIHDLTTEALATLRPEARFIYEKHHGVDATGVTHPQTIKETSEQLGWHHSSTSQALHQAEACVYKTIATWLIKKEFARLEESIWPQPGAGVVTGTTATEARIRGGSASTEHRIKLGEGSEAALRAAKNSCTGRRNQALIIVHQRYAK